MSVKILTKNAIDNTNIDGARDFHFNAGLRSGIVKGALNEGNFFASASNVIALDTCELRICGHRVIIDSAQSFTMTSSPVSPTRYSLIAEIIVDNSSVPTFNLFIQSASTPLIQNNLHSTTTGAGTYQLEIGRFTHLTNGNVDDIVRTADLITGGTTSSNGEINIGNVVTTTLDAGLDAEVDVETRLDQQTNKTYTDFSFSIPQGAVPNISVAATTLAAGSSATVTKTGTNVNPTFTFGIPQGTKGDTGATIVSTVLQGQDANGGNIYLQTFDDGSTATFTAPKGDQGSLIISSQSFTSISDLFNFLVPYYNNAAFYKIIGIRGISNNNMTRSSWITATTSASSTSFKDNDHYGVPVAWASSFTAEDLWHLSSFCLGGYTFVLTDNLNRSFKIYNGTSSLNWVMNSNKVESSSITQEYAEGTITVNSTYPITIYYFV